MRLGHQCTPPAARPAASRALLLAAMLFLAACSTSSPPVLKTPPVASPTSIPAGPQPVTGLLGLAPASCPTAPSLQTKTFAHFGGFVGPVTFQGGPVVWVAGAYFPGTLHLEANGYTAYPGTKIIWELGPNYTQSATAQLTNLTTGALAWWGKGGPPASRAVTSQSLGLHANGSSPADLHGSPEPGWLEYGSFAYFAQAGCYAMNVTWPGGHWRAIVAVGH